MRTHYRALCDDTARRHHGTDTYTRGSSTYARLPRMNPRCFDTSRPSTSSTGTRNIRRQRRTLPTHHGHRGILIRMASASILIAKVKL